MKLCQLSKKDRNILHLKRETLNSMSQNSLNISLNCEKMADIFFQHDFIGKISGHVKNLCHLPANIAVVNALNVNFQKPFSIDIFIFLQKYYTLLD